MKYRSGLYMVNPPEKAKVEYLPPQTGVVRKRSYNPSEGDADAYSTGTFPKDLQENPMSPDAYQQVFDVMKGLKKASKSHSAQAEELRQVLKDDWDEEPHSNPHDPQHAAYNPPYEPYSSKAPYASSPQSNPGYYEDNPHRYEKVRPEYEGIPRTSYYTWREVQDWPTREIPEEGHVIKINPETDEIVHVESQHFHRGSYRGTNRVQVPTHYGDGEVGYDFAPPKKVQDAISRAFIEYDTHSNPHDPHHAAYNPPYHPHTGPPVWRPRGPYGSRALDALYVYVDEEDSYHQAAHRLMDSLEFGTPVKHNDLSDTIIEMRVRYKDDPEVAGIIRLLDTEVSAYADEPDYYLQEGPVPEPYHRPQVYYRNPGRYDENPPMDYDENPPMDMPDMGGYLANPGIAAMALPALAGAIGGTAYGREMPTDHGVEGFADQNPEEFDRIAYDHGYIRAWDTKSMRTAIQHIEAGGDPDDFIRRVIRPMSNPPRRYAEGYNPNAVETIGSRHQKMANLARQVSRAYATLARKVAENPTAEDIEEARFEGIAPGDMFHWQADYFLGVADGMEAGSTDPSGVNVHRRVLALQGELKRRGLMIGGLNKAVDQLFGKYGLQRSPNPPARMGTSKYRAKRPFGGRTSSGKPRYRKGSGGRFEACVDEMSQRSNVDDPEALCASIGRKAYGRKGMASMAARGRSKNPPALPYKQNTEDF